MSVLITSISKSYTCLFREISKRKCKFPRLSKKKMNNYSPWPNERVHSSTEHHGRTSVESICFREDHPKRPTILNGSHFRRASVADWRCRTDTTCMCTHGQCIQNTGHPTAGTLHLLRNLYPMTHLVGALRVRYHANGDLLHRSYFLLG